MGLTLVQRIEGQLAKASKRSDFKKLLNSLFESLVQLDSGMIDGRVVAESEKRATYDQLRVLASRAFQAFAAVDGKAAAEWVTGLTVWQRPRNLDLSTWTTNQRGEGAPVAVLPTDDELGATLLFEGTILDDDGVAVIASLQAIKTRYSRRAFDYEFPKALLEGMAAHELVCWRTGGEGEHAIALEKVNNAGAFKRIAGGETTPEFAIEVAQADSLLILPYSQFTFGCSAGGEFDLKGRRGASLSVAPGLYAVRVLRSGVEDGDFGGSSFRVLLCAAEAPSLETDPGEDESDLPGWRE